MKWNYIMERSKEPIIIKIYIIYKEKYIILSFY
jgi:hypothetical protein